jgi:intracellular sulfur oxidation DsrE/DsrF family protein
MKMTSMTNSVVAMMALGLAWAAPVAAQSSSQLPVAGYPAAQDIPGAHELPDPKMDYKVVFAIGQGAEDSTAEVNPMLPLLARYVNTLAKHGVPAEKRNLVVMFHQRSADFDIVMSNEAFKAQYGKDNPNIELIHALTKAGVEFRACGQGLVARKIEASQMNPDIQVDLWAMTSIVNLQMRGFARVGN